MRIAAVIVLIWLIIGALAAGQRGYYKGPADTCAGMGTIALTIVAGPLNYLGVNPKVADCDTPDLPQPSP
jgi:ABC-type dipeptide/oligopeptide/nickel transport system permease subunit